MLKKQGIGKLLFLLIVVVSLFTVENLFLNHLSASEPLSQHNGAATEPLQPSSTPYVESPSASQPISPTSVSADSTASQSVLETSYKRYSLCRYGKNYILCEPYTVQHGDWIYKIFRSKGEISKDDFGLFLKIFKEINPGIQNMNTIKKGQTITIPLKKSNRNDFQESKPGVVDLPIITLSQFHDKLSKSTKPVQEKGVGMAIQSANSSATAIDDQEPPTSLEPSSAIPVRQLKQLAMMNNGQLMMRGKYYFPRDHGEDLVVDVAFNPLMSFKNGSKILFVPQKSAFDGFTETIKMFWKDFKIMEFGEVSSSLNGPILESSALSGLHSQKYSLEEEPSTLQTPQIEPLESLYVPINLTIPHDQKAAVKQLLELTECQYKSEKEISVSVGAISVKTAPAIISRVGKPDILLVFGDIYGSALEALKKMKQGDVVTISPLLTDMDVARKLFSALGASTTENPSFVNPDNNQTVSIDGVYIKSGDKELFLTEKPVLLKEAFRYLTDKKITILRVETSS